MSDNTSETNVTFYTADSYSDTSSISNLLSSQET